MLKDREGFLIRAQDCCRKLEELLESGDPDGFELIGLVKEQREYRQ